MSLNESPKEQKTATERMKSYIDEHLRDPITLRDLATAAGYSQFYAGRVFKAQTGVSPFEYVRSKRLTAAARELRSGDRRVLDVALDFVFDSHEGFTRAFSKGFGITPSRFASQAPQDGWLIPFRYSNRLKSKSEEFGMNQVGVIFTQIVERPERKLILKRSNSADNYVDYTKETGCGDDSPWNFLVGVKEALYEPVGLWLPENMRPADTGEYAHGVEVPPDYDGEVPNGFDVIDLEPSKMMVFQGEPYDDDEYRTAVSDCMEKIRSFNPEVYGYEYASDLSPRMQLAPQGWRGYIEMLPVKPI